MHKRFSEEFKKSAIIRVQNGESQLSVANSLGISYKTLNRWIIQAKGQMPSENVSLSEENARLRKALKEREAEIAFLKISFPFAQKFLQAGNFLFGRQLFLGKFLFGLRPPAVNRLTTDSQAFGNTHLGLTIANTLNNGSFKFLGKLFHLDPFDA